MLVELPARNAAGLRPGAADAKSTDMDAGEPGSDCPMSMSMLCIDTCMHTRTLPVASEKDKEVSTRGCLPALEGFLRRQYWLEQHQEASCSGKGQQYHLSCCQHGSCAELAERAGTLMSQAG